MRTTLFLAASAALALSGCSKGADAPADANNEPESQASADAAGDTAEDPISAVTFTAGEPPSAEFMVGTWGESNEGECDDPITFEAGGTVAGDLFDTWAITEGTLAMDEDFKMAVIVMDANTMEGKREGDSEVTTLIRCDP